MRVKWLFDAATSFLGLLVLFPIIFIISLLIITTSKGGMFFKQARVGQHGKVFNILKFRTMVTNAESKGLKISTSDDTRITKVGSFLRKWKLDELPQLINVLKGEMSLVGPRPEVPEYMQHYSKEDQKIILSVKPGVTDWASIRFRNENEILANAKDIHQTYIKEILPIKRKYYLEYVENLSLRNDLVILWNTLCTVFFR